MDKYGSNVEMYSVLHRQLRSSCFEMKVSYLLFATVVIACGQFSMITRILTCSHTQLQHFYCLSVIQSALTSTSTVQYIVM
jgi:hypothetical protein